YTSGQSYTIDQPPYVVGISRQLPLSAITSASSVNFRITFSEQVSGVDASDFSLFISGTAAGTLAAGAVVPVGTSGIVYDVTVTSVTGAGNLRLDLKSTATNIIDVVGIPITGGFSTGEIYQVDRI